MSAQAKWTHPSVLALQKEANGRDPLDEIERRAEELALSAMEKGWSGPPFDPFQLADHLGVEMVGREDLEDARLVSSPDGPRIEFNPQRRPARVRFSVAHEIGHLLFSDYGERVRYRSHNQDARGDDWQLEMLCNVAAAELLMPVGAFPTARASDLSLPHLLDLRQRFGVSTEALLRRVVKLADQPMALFAAARQQDGNGFRLDYLVTSRAWSVPQPGVDSIPSDSVLARCTAVGFSAEATERWDDLELRVQAVGIPPYPGDRLPRVVGLAATGLPAERSPGLRYLRGDATNPVTTGVSVIAHIVNNRARRWSQRGFAGALARRFPPAGDLYEQWDGTDARQLGAVHFAKLSQSLWVASLTAQAGYGETNSGQQRLRLTALRDALQRLASMALEHEASVHMPLIGTGQAGGSWPVVRDLVLAELVDRRVPVTVYVLPEQPMPEEDTEAQLTLV
jgi:hypothetical protein